MHKRHRSVHVSRCVRPWGLHGATRKATCSVAWSHNVYTTAHSAAASEAAESYPIFLSLGWRHSGMEVSDYLLPACSRAVHNGSGRCAATSVPCLNRWVPNRFSGAFLPWWGQGSRLASCPCRRNPRNLSRQSPREVFDLALHYATMGECILTMLRLGADFCC